MVEVQVAEIVRIELVVADLGRSVAFYTGVLGFREAAAAPSAAGGDGARVLRLGAQEIALRPAAPGAAPYPSPRGANDPFFQHFAIAVSDMGAAYASLRAFGHEAISRGGPQRLPPSTGSVTAYKFRDPDGHPLELSLIPGSAWLRDAAASGGGPFLGIDHTALAAPDLPAAVAFYTGLGLEEDGRFLNTGPEQDRLDGLDGVVLDIAALRLPAGGPHIELLSYRQPAPAHAAPAASTEPRAGDVAATRTRLRPATPLSGTREMTDPAGHRLVLEG